MVQEKHVLQNPFPQAWFKEGAFHETLVVLIYIIVIWAQRKQGGNFQIFSYASSSTLYPRQRASK